MKNLVKQTIQLLLSWTPENRYNAGYSSAMKALEGAEGVLPKYARFNAKYFNEGVTDAINVYFQL